MKKLLFLDIDGVLNTPFSKSWCGDNVGIEKDKLDLLKKIIDNTGALIVLISTWKQSWQKDIKRKYLQDDFANYLDTTLGGAGLSIYDKTPNQANGVWLSRGEGILYYLDYLGTDRFVIIDDCQFDYDGCELTDYFVQTSTEVGLCDEHVQKAIKLLNN